MDARRNLLLGYKAIFGLLGLSAVVTEIVTLATNGRLNSGNFFSYFTIESNVLAFVTLFLGVLILATGRESRSFDLLRGAAALYMTITGIVFAILLAPIPNGQFTAVPWDNIVLHYIIPLAMFLDWVLD